MNGSLLVEKLLCYAEKHLHLEAVDKTYVRNVLLSELKAGEPYEG